MKKHFLATVSNDYDQLTEMYDLVYDKIGFQFLKDGSKLKIQDIRQKVPQIFDWLDLSDLNVYVILVLMLIVAGFNMISG